MSDSSNPDIVMSELSRPYFRYSVNVQKAVEVLLPGNKAAMEDLRAGRPLTRHLQPLASQPFSPGYSLLAAVGLEGWREIPQDARLALQRHLLAQTTNAVAALERTDPHYKPTRVTSQAMKKAIEVLRQQNGIPVSSKSIEFGLPV